MGYIRYIRNICSLYNVNLIAARHTDGQTNGGNGHTDRHLRCIMMSQKALHGRQRIGVLRTYGEWKKAPLKRVLHIYKSLDT